jgi:hypothetical protein
VILPAGNTQYAREQADKMIAATFAIRVALMTNIASADEA